MVKSEVPLTHGSISWSALFYDLIIVAVLARATYIYGNDPSWQTFAFITIALLALYVLWSMTTLELLLSKSESWSRRAMVLVQVCALLASALAMYRGGGLSDRWGFIALSVAFLSIAALTQLRRGELGADQRSLWPLTFISVITAAIFGIGALFPMGFEVNGFQIAWAFYGVGTLFAATGFVIVAPQLIVTPSPIQRHLLNERFGVLLLIALGDAFVQIIEVLGKMRSIPQPEFLGLTLLFVVAVWLLYYPTLSDPSLPATVWQARSRIAAHFVLVAGGAFGIVAFVELATGFGDSSHETKWSSLPVLAVVVAILWLTRLHHRLWTAQATVLAVAAGLLLLLSIATDYADSISRELDLVCSNLIAVAAALIVLWLNHKGQKRKHITT